MHAINNIIIQEIVEKDFTGEINKILFLKDISFRTLYGDEIET